VSRPVHDRAQLGAYALGALDPTEARVVHDHLAGCLDCQREVSELMMIRRALDQVPPEAFVDGPPEDGELLLQRTLRQVRAESAPQRGRVPLAAMAAAVAVGVALAGGVLLGRQTVSTPAAAPATATSTPSNARLAEATDPVTGTVMRVALEPKKGWVWVHADVTGLPVGARCELYVVPRDGAPILAGSWLVSEDGSKNGTRLEGTALIPPTDVASVQVRTVEGQTMVTVPV
jgi:putative zinc finger protein